MDSITAMHFVNFKLRDDAGLNVVDTFFKSFKTNFKQSIILTVVFGGVGAFLAIGWINALQDFSNINKTEVGILTIASFLFFIFESFSTYVLAKFDNPFGHYLFVVVYAISAGIDVAVKLALFEMAMVAGAVIIVIVNPSVVIFIVAFAVLFLVLVVYEMLAGAWIIPVYNILLAPRKKQNEQSENAEEEADESNNEEIGENEDK